MLTALKNAADAGAFRALCDLRAFIFVCVRLASACVRLNPFACD